MPHHKMSLEAGAEMNPKLDLQMGAKGNPTAKGEAKGDILRMADAATPAETASVRPASISQRPKMKSSQSTEQCRYNLPPLP